MTLWIREVADDEICPRVPFGAHSARPAEALGFTERGLDVGNANVKDHVTVVVDASANPTRDPRPIAGGVAVYEPVIPRLGDRWNGAFAVYGGHGTTQSSTIVYEIEPGGRLGWHTDATEETQYSHKN